MARPKKSTALVPTVVQESPEERLQRLAETRERWERTQRILSDPDLLNVICSYVASGGTLVTLADTWQVRFGDLSNWIHSLPEREQRYFAALNDRDEWGLEQILKELFGIAMSDVALILNPDGSLKPVDQWPSGASRSIQSIKINELFEGTGRERTQIGWTKEVKFWDKTKAIELLGKKFKAWVERIDLSGSVKLEDILAAANKLPPPKNPIDSDKK